MQVVERDQERPARGEVRRQPVETVQRRKRRVPSRLDRDLGGIKKRRCARRRAVEQLRSLVSRQGGDQRLEELQHHPVGKRAFKVGAARTEHLQPCLPSQRPRLRKQRGLADTGRTLDREQPTAVGDRVDQATNRGKLGIALEQVELDERRLLMRPRGTSSGGLDSSRSLPARPRTAVVVAPPRRRRRSRCGRRDELAIARVTRCSSCGTNEACGGSLRSSTLVKAWRRPTGDTWGTPAY